MALSNRTQKLIDVLHAIKEDTSCKWDCKTCLLCKRFAQTSCELAIFTIKEAEEGNL